MNDAELLEVTDETTGHSWVEEVRNTSMVVAMLRNYGSPWEDVATGYTYRWAQ